MWLVDSVYRLGGVVMSYDEVRKLGFDALHSPKDNLLHFEIIANLLIFKPVIGQPLQVGWKPQVVLISDNHYHTRNTTLNSYKNDKAKYEVSAT